MKVLSHKVISGMGLGETLMCSTHIPQNSWRTLRHLDNYVSGCSDHISTYVCSKSGFANNQTEASTAFTM